MENKVTIIIPSRNIDYLLENCISQIRNQYKNIKIVLVLDSIDSNLKHVEPNIKIIKSENTNMSAKEIALKAMEIASSICVFTNNHFTIEEV